TVASATSLVALELQPLPFPIELPVINVTHTGGVFGGGITYITGQGDDAVIVTATRAGEPLLLDSGGGLDSVTVGDNGNAQQILGTVTVQNTPRFTDLLVDNSSAANAGATVTIEQDAIRGLAPADIRFVGDDINDIEIRGGTSPTTYNALASIAASDLMTVLGGGASVNVGEHGVVNNALFPGPLFFESGPDIAPV